MGPQALDGPRETESPDFLDCTLIDGLLFLLPVVSPTDREGCDGGTWKWANEWNVVRPTVRGPPRGRWRMKRRYRSGLAHTALCVNQRMIFWPERVPFVPLHLISTFLAAALGLRRLNSVDCIKQASVLLTLGWVWPVGSTSVLEGEKLGVSSLSLHLAGPLLAVAMFIPSRHSHISYCFLQGLFLLTHQVQGGKTPLHASPSCFYRC